MRALQDAAIEHESYSTTQVVTLLKSMTRLVEKVDANGKGTGQFDVMVDFPDKDATTGQSVMTSKTPTEAVKRMTEIPEFQNLFRKKRRVGCWRQLGYRWPYTGFQRTD